MNKDGECCGKCIEVACIIKLSNNTVHVLDVSIPFIFRSLCSPIQVRTAKSQLMSLTSKKLMNTEITLKTPHQFSELNNS